MGRVVIGAVTGSFGVKGWVKVRSFTDPPENILSYLPWRLEGPGRCTDCQVRSGNLHGHDVVVVAMEGVSTREEAQALKGLQVVVDRGCFPPPAPGEYYRVDLLGVTVRNLQGRVLGSVKDVMSTGANDVLVVLGERERLIPFVQPQIIREIDLQSGFIEVDWDETF